jgi:hypothetical protein
MRQRKYVKGAPLTIDEAVQHILAGRYVFERNKPQHPGWAMSWSLGLLRGFCAGGNIFEAIPNPEYVEKTK